MIVYPRLAPSHRLDRIRGTAEGGDPRDRRQGRGAEIRASFATRASATTRETSTGPRPRGRGLIVKDSAAEEGRDAVIVVDTHRPVGADSAWDEAFERAVSEAAAVALRLLAAGDRVGLALGARLVPPALGPAQRRSLLEILALAEPSQRAGASARAAPRRYRLPCRGARPATAA